MITRAPFDLDAYLAAERVHVEGALARAVRSMSGSVSREVGEAIAHGVTTGGKRLRPILCVSAYRAAGGEASDAVYELGASLELIHAYSLMHDDLPCMDDADLRRGVPTTHRLHGERSAMLAGAALIPLAALHALRACGALGCPAPTARSVALRLLAASGAGGMVGGQWLDLLGEGRSLSGGELDRLHAHKTGALLTAALAMGGLAAGAEARVIEGLERYGAAIGLAFQIADDVLDATGSAEELGKNPSDAELRKSTYVSLHGLDDARARARAQVEAALEALVVAEIDAPALAALASYVVERNR